MMKPVSFKRTLYFSHKEWQGVQKVRKDLLKLKQDLLRIFPNGVRPNSTEYTIYIGKLKNKLKNSSPQLCWGDDPNPPSFAGRIGSITFSTLCFNWLASQ